MNNLPDEILLMIFDNLPPRILWSIISKVCRRWKNLVSHRVVTMCDYSKMLTLHTGVVGIYARRDPFTIQLPQMAPLAFAIKLHTMNIRELVLCDNYPLGDNFVKLLDSVITLRHLDIFTLTNLHKSCLPPAQVTSIVLNNNIRPDYLLHLASRQEINSLYMYGKTQFYAVNEMELLVGLHSSHLTHLTLRCPELKDARWIVFSQCTNLQQLHLYSCWSVTAKGVSHVVNLPKLKVLHITGCRMVYSHSLMKLIGLLSPGIVELNLSATQFGPEHVAALAGALPRLRRLELWCCGVRAPALLQLAARLESLRRLDTDVELARADVARLDRHPALQELRCCFKEPVASRLRVLSARADAPFPVRACGEGAAADVFLHADAYDPIDGLTLQHSCHYS